MEIPIRIIYIFRYVGIFVYISDSFYSTPQKKFVNSSLIDHISLIITISVLILVSLKSLFNSLSIDTTLVMVMKSWKAHYGWF